MYFYIPFPHDFDTSKFQVICLIQISLDYGLDRDEILWSAFRSILLSLDSTLLAQISGNSQWWSVYDANIFDKWNNGNRVARANIFFSLWHCPQRVLQGAGQTPSFPWKNNHCPPISFEINLIKISNSMLTGLVGLYILNSSHLCLRMTRHQYN